jgi:2-haloacid dehalogenase
VAHVSPDLLSALMDSRAGGTAAMDRIGARRGWPVDGVVVYDAWDPRNRESQQQTVDWVPFAEHSRRALNATSYDLGLRGDPDVDAGRLMESVADWPLRPDVTAASNRLRTAHRVGVLSNVDDAVFAQMQVAPLLDPVDVLTGERLHAYKPAPGDQPENAAGRCRRARAGDCA